MTNPETLFTESQGIIKFTQLGEPYRKWCTVKKDPNNQGGLICELPQIDTWHGFSKPQYAYWDMQYFTASPTETIVYGVLDEDMGFAGHPHPFSDPPKEMQRAIDAVACWADLLGITSNLIKNNWDLDLFAATPAALALKKMLRTLAQPSVIGSPANPLSGEDVVLASNDGVARILDWPRPYHMSLPKDRFELALRRYYTFISECCERVHIARNNDFPMISVIASGSRIQFLESPVQRTRSVIRAKMLATGIQRASTNPEVLYEREFIVTHEICRRPVFHAFLPPQLQMNTAFVAAYKIEEWLHGRGISHEHKTEREKERSKSTNRIYISKGALLLPGSDSYRDIFPKLTEDINRMLECENKIQLSFPYAKFTIEFDEMIDLRKAGVNDIPECSSIIYRISKVQYCLGDGREMRKNLIEFIS